jgi:hypothetical protein
LTVIDVAFKGEVVYRAFPFLIGRHVHPAVPQAKAEPPDTGPGIDLRVQLLPHQV